MIEVQAEAESLEFIDKNLTVSESGVKGSHSYRELWLLGGWVFKESSC